MPFAYQQYFIGMQPQHIHALDSPALVNGQYMLLRRESYFAVGGHAANTGSIIDDVALATRYKTSRFVRLTHHGLFPDEIAQTGVHRHYTLRQLRTMLGPTYEIQRTICTGFGLAELVNLPLLFFCRYVCAWEKLYQILQYVYFLAYLLEDQFPLPVSGYHLVVAIKQVPPAVPQSQTLTQ